MSVLREVADVLCGVVVVYILPAADAFAGAAASPAHAVRGWLGKRQRRRTA